MTSKLDKYTVGRLLGQGAFAKVKLAVDTEMNEKVALKIMEVQDGEGFRTALEQTQNEVEKVSCLSHPNVVNVVQVAREGILEKQSGRQKRVVYVALEYCSKGTFIDYLIETGAF